MATYEELHSRLMEAQSKLSVPKDNFNSFGGFRYRSAEGIEKALKPVLSELGLTLTLSDAIISVGSHEYVETTATLFLGDIATSVTAYARHPDSKKGMDDAQLTGLTSSYARKSALCAMFLIDDGVDNDTEAEKKPSYKNPIDTSRKTAKKPQKTAKEQAWDNIKRFASANNIDPKQIAHEISNRPDYVDNEGFWTSVVVEFGG